MGICTHINPTPLKLQIYSRLYFLLPTSYFLLPFLLTISYSSPQVPLFPIHGNLWFGLSLDPQLFLL
ncbi:hypothetical protein N7488_004852 [Penicillium malachiteum]|nr:hypothetical protein N7488_004852 [Penicillium malachiteum]